jgi:hypothetical protein
MGGTVFFKLDGRFCNNVFQFFAAHIIKKIYNLSEVKKMNSISDATSYKIVDENLYIKIIKSINEGDTPPDLGVYTDIVMIGYFQNSIVMKDYRDYLKSLFNKENSEVINDTVKTDQVIKPLSFTAGLNDLVMHIRLDDYATNGGSDIFSPQQLLEIIKDINYEKLYIVCDKLRYDWEVKYITYFRHLNPILIQNSMLDDFNFIVNANKILLSASTFSYIAAFLSNASEIHIPYNTFYPQQNMDSFGPECKVYKGMKFWKVGT